MNGEPSTETLPGNLKAAAAAYASKVTNVDAGGNTVTCTSAGRKPCPTSPGSVPASRGL